MADLLPNRGMRFLAAGLGFIAFAGSLILIVFYRFLIPAAEMAKGIEKDAIAKKQLSAISTAVMVVVLVSLLGVLVLMFRPIKSLLSNKTNPRTTTKYQDAWAEAGRRVKPDDEPSDQTPQE